MTDPGRSRMAGLARWAVRRRPSPAMVVAIVALVMATGGTTYAVTKLPRDSVGTSQLRKNAVRTENIRDGAVTAAKLAKGLLPVQAASTPLSNPVTPADHVLFADRAGFASSADTAGRATTAESADSAGRAAVADHATLADRATKADSVTTADNAGKLDGRDSTAFLPRGLIVDVPQFSLSDGGRKDLFHLGPFTATAQCEIDVTTATGVTDTAEVLLSTTEGHSVMDGFTVNSNMDPGDPDFDRVLIAVSPPHGTPEFESSADGTFAAPGGTEVRSAVLYAGVNIFNQPGTCFFGGYFLI